MQLMPIHATVITPSPDYPREFTHTLALRSSIFPPILNSQTLAFRSFDSPRYAPRTSTSPAPLGPRPAARSLSLPSIRENPPRTSSTGRASRTGRGTGACRTAAGARRRVDRWRRWCVGASSYGFRARRCQEDNLPEGWKDWRLRRRGQRTRLWPSRAGWQDFAIWSWRPRREMRCKSDIYCQHAGAQVRHSWKEHGRRHWIFTPKGSTYGFPSFPRTTPLGITFGGGGGSSPSRSVEGLL